MSNEGLISDFAPLLYTETLTGGTVRGGHTITRAIDANIIGLARPARRIGPVQSQKTDGSTYSVGYTRSHTSITQLWLAWYFHGDFTNTPATISMDLTITDAIGNSIASSSDLIPVGFKGTATDAIQAATTYDSSILLGAEGYLDLAACAAVLTDPTWNFEFVYTASTTHVPLDRIEGWECPRSQVDDGDSYGSLTGPDNPGSPIVSGSTTTNGYERLMSTISAAALCGRTLLSIAWPTVTTIAPGTSSATFTAFTRMLESGTTPWSWYVRPRMLYAPNSATGEPHRVRVFYEVTGGGTAAVQCNATSVGALSVGTATITSLASATWAWSDWQTINIPTDGTGRLVAITFEGKTTAGSFYIAGIELEENQT